MTQAWNILHVLAMFIAFAFTTGIGIFVTILARGTDVRVIRTATRVAGPLLNAGAIIFVLGVVLGFATAGAIGFSMSSKWLVITYFLVIVLLVVGIGVHRMWVERLHRAAIASPDDSPSPELRSVIDDRGVMIAGPVSGLLWIAIIALMILRPM